MSQLTDRYVAAVLRSMPTDRKADVDRELRAAIDDAIEPRLDAGEDFETVEAAVLTDLGDPDRLAADYSDRPLWLIGPSVYFHWLRLLKRLLATLVPLAGIAAMVVHFIVDGSLAGAFSEGLGLAVLVALHVVFWTTLAFVVLERTGEKWPDKWSVEHLPQVPDRQIGYGETVWSLVTAILTILAIFAQREWGLVTDAEGNPVPIINPDAWDTIVPLILGLLVVEAVFQVVKYRVGRWTYRLATVNLAINVVFASVVIWALLSDRLLNEEFFEVLAIVTVPPTVYTALVVAVVSVWSVVEGFVKARRSQ